MKFLNRIRKIPIYFVIPAIIICCLGVIFLVTSETAQSPATIKNKTNVTTITFSPTPKTDQISIKPSGYSLTNPASVWVIVNKQHPLMLIDYVPDDLVSTNGAIVRSIAETDFDAMMVDSIAQGIYLTIVSSYRSYYTQDSLYNNYVSIYGQTDTDTFSARPGYSEHQTGLAIDFGSNTNVSCSLDSCFGETNEGQWLLSHAYEYGYILRYPVDKTTITGYKSEPWHYRYVGRELATEMKQRSISTLEEFFNVSGGEIYN